MAIRDLTKETGRSGLRTYGGLIYESTLFKLQGPERNLKLRAMGETDDVVSGILQTFEVLGRGVNWWVKPFDDKDAQDVERATFVWDALNDMNKSWGDCLSDIYSMLEYGFAPLELVYKARRGPRQANPKFRSKYDDGKWGWRKWMLLGQTTVYRWQFDEAGGIEALTQLLEGDQSATAIGMLQQPIPIEKLLLFRTTSRKDNPEGRAIGEGAFRTWFRKHHLEDVEVIAAENNLVGIPFIQGPEAIDKFKPADDASRTEVTAALDFLTTLRHGEAQAGFIPHGWGEPQLIKSPGTPTVDIDKLLRRFDSRIAISMLAGFVLTGFDKHGSFALSKNQIMQLILAINAYNDSICDTVNRHAIPRLADLNDWPLERLPTLEHGEPNFTEVKDALDGIKTLGSIGSEVPLKLEVQRQVLGKIGLELSDELMEELREDEEEEREAKRNAPPFPGNLDIDDGNDDEGGGGGGGAGTGGTPRGEGEDEPEV